MEECKTQVEAFLVKARATDLTTAKYKVQKRLQSREGISKKDVPANIWTQYAKKSEFAILTFIALAKKRCAFGKSKAKKKAARIAGVKPKAKAKGQ